MYIRDYVKSMGLVQGHGCDIRCVESSGLSVSTYDIYHLKFALVRIRLTTRPRPGFIFQARVRHSPSTPFCWGPQAPHSMGKEDLFCMV